MTDPQPSMTFTAYWLYRATEARFELEPEDVPSISSEATTIFEEHVDTVTLRGAYSTIGFDARTHLILWVHTAEMRNLNILATDLHNSAFSAFFEPVEVYVGAASGSQYDPSHTPAFLRGVAPKDYLSVYPFTKTPDWYLLDYEERRRLMGEHGQMGRDYPSILTNTTSSFGFGDQEFIVAIEEDDPATLLRMVQQLRAAEVRKYTAVDTPIFFGRRMPIDEAISSAL